MTGLNLSARAMKALDMSKLQRKSTRDRADAEAHTQAGIEEDGRKRLRSGKDKALLYRCTPERREQITRLAEALSAGQTFGRTVKLHRHNRRGS